MEEDEKRCQGDFCKRSGEAKRGANRRASNAISFLKNHVSSYFRTRHTSSVTSAINPHPSSQPLSRFALLIVDYGFIAQGDPRRCAPPILPRRREGNADTELGRLHVHPHRMLGRRMVQFLLSSARNDSACYYDFFPASLWGDPHQE